jgi:hypothetical protein
LLLGHQLSPSPTSEVLLPAEIPILAVHFLPPLLAPAILQALTNMLLVAHTIGMSLQDEFPPCDCEQPGYCEHFKLNLIGRLWELAKLDNELGAQYRRLWTLKAGAGTVVKPRPPKGCQCGQAKQVGKSVEIAYRLT